MLNPNDWQEIKQSEYKRLKQEDPHNCNSYTARIGFKFYKKIDAGIKTSLNKAVGEFEEAWDNLTARQQESVKEYLRCKLKMVIK